MISFRIICLCLIAACSAFAEHHRVVVIGAGLAGLTTAYRIQQMTGQSVEVYEARERVGGRVLTAYFDGSHEELGGKFIGVTESLHLKALIDEMGLQIEDYATTISQRKYVYQGKIDPYYAAFMNSPYPDESTYNMLKEWANEEKNLGALLNAFFVKQDIPRHLAEIRMRGFEGNDTKDLSIEYLNSFWNYYDRSYLVGHKSNRYTASHETVKGGNSRLPEKLAEMLREHLHLGWPLRKISLTSNGKYLLEFSGSKTVTADFLVLAIPCSTLKNVKIDKGIIPSDQWEAIKTLQYGTNGYVLLSVHLSGNESNAEYSVTEDTITWFNKDLKILTLAYGGRFGIFNAKSVKDIGSIIKREIPALKMLFPSFEYTGENRAVSWINEEFSKGSDCSWAPGQFKLFNETVEALGEKVRKVFRPVNNKIFFAGEHASVDHPATMEGAVESGEVAAKMVIQTVFPSKEKETTGPGS